MRHTVFSTHLTIEIIMALLKKWLHFKCCSPGEPRLQNQLFPLSLLDFTDWSEFHGIYTAFESKYIAIEVSNINPTIYFIMSFFCVSQLLSIDVSSDVSIHAYNLSVYFIWILSVYPQDICITNQQHAA